VVGLRAAWISLIALTTLLAGCMQSRLLPFADLQGSSGVPVPFPPCYTRHCHRNAIPAWWQWMNNDGYCGETALMTAGMYYGEYASEYTVRQLASGHQWLRNTSNYQLLLGVNAATAAARMHLSAIPFPSGASSSQPDTWSTQRFLTTVKRYVLQGYPVIIGVYENGLILNAGGSTADSQYDHIVPVLGVGSDHPFAAGNTAYYANDYLIFSDNGLYGPDPPNHPPSDGTALPPFYFPNTYASPPSYIDADSYPHYEFGVFEKTRVRATKSKTSYSLALNNPSKGKPGNFGVAVTGVIDQSHETVPVRLVTNLFIEFPYISQGSKKNPSPAPPSPEPMTFTVTVWGLMPGTSYKLYEYDGATADTFPKVPNRDFNAHASEATNAWKFTATATTFTIAPTPKPGGSYMSDRTVVFRAVPAAAP
jgi:hypothetical protein